MAIIQHYTAKVGDFIKLLEDIKNLHNERLAELLPVRRQTSPKSNMFFGDFPHEDVDATKENILTNITDGTQIHIDPELALWASLPKKIWESLSVLKIIMVLNL